MKISKEDLKVILSRDEHPPLDDLSFYEDKTVLITGACGSIGTALSKELDGICVIVPTDIDNPDVFDLDVTNEEACKYFLQKYDPDIVFHLAGAKHAPEGELDPINTLTINTLGVKNMIDNLSENSTFVLASTCKAGDPETAYGASKLIAEKYVLNLGGNVTRFFNVAQSSENVFEIWDAVPEDEPILATNCGRYFISIDEAVSLLLWAAQMESGRYAVNAEKLTNIYRMALRLYPHRNVEEIAPRRGDRITEPFHAKCEFIVQYHEDDRFVQLYSPYDKA